MRPSSPDLSAAPSAPPLAPAPAGDEWQFAFAPYLWLAGLDGQIGLGGRTADVDLDFGDILENLDVGLMGAFEARKGRWILDFDSLWLRLKTRTDYDGLFYNTARSRVEEVRLQAMLGYRVLEGPTSIDLLAGASYFYLDNELRLGGGPLDELKLGSSEDWCDPVVAVALKHRFGERWFATGRGMIGGFGVGSDLTWQVVAALGYRLSEHFSVLGGYRHLAIDYQSGDFLYDAATSGFILGVGIEW